MRFWNAALTEALKLKAGLCRAPRSIQLCHILAYAKNAGDLHRPRNQTTASRQATFPPPPDSSWNFMRNSPASPCSPSRADAFRRTVRLEPSCRSTYSRLCNFPNFQ